MKPSLSIILPNYNHAHYLSKAITSVLEQNFEAFELIIIDDGSSDNSVELIEKWIKKDQRIRLIKHEKNQGIAAGVKSGLHVAQGKYIHGLSASDSYRPGFLHKSFTLLKQFPEIGLCCTDTGLFVDDPAQYTATFLIENAPGALVFPADHIQQVFKYAHFSIPGLTAIIKKTSFLKYGGYRSQLHFLCDGVLNQQIALSEGAIYIPEPLVVYRRPEYSRTSSQNRKIRSEALHNLKELLLHPENRDLLCQMRKAASLGMLCKELPGDCLKNFQLLRCYPDLIERYLYKRFRMLLGKPLVSVDFLRRHSLKIPEHLVSSGKVK